MRVYRFPSEDELQRIPEYCALTQAQRRVVRFVLDEREPYRPVYLPVMRIASECSMSERTVRRAIAPIQKSGLLDIAEARNEVGGDAPKSFAVGPRLRGWFGRRGAVSLRAR